MRINNNHLIRINSNSRETTFFFFLIVEYFLAFTNIMGKKLQNYKILLALKFTKGRL